MDFLDGSRQSLIPSFLYSSTSKTLDLQKILNRNSSFSKSPSPSASISSNGASKAFVVPAPSEPGKIEMYSPAFYAACTVGGILSCGLTHTTVTPLDLVKCNMQGLLQGFFLDARDLYGVTRPEIQWLQRKNS